MGGLFAALGLLALLLPDNLQTPSCSGWDSVVCTCSLASLLDGLG